MENINVRFGDLLNYQGKANKIIISVEVNPQGEVFVLTYGNGIKKVAADGTFLDFISGANFNAPMDLAINSEGKFYVAVNSTEGKNIKVFSPTGTALPGENFSNGDFGTGVNYFKGPVGITFDSADNLYVADHYIGASQTPEPSRVKIFYKVNGSYKNDQFLEFTSVQGNSIISPFRISVNNEGLIFVADEASDGKGRVLVIQIVNRVPILVDVLAGTEDNLGSPGDIVIDQLGYIYIADFGNQLNLPVILNAGNDPYKLIDYFDVVKNGIRDEVFKIRVYTPQRQYQGYLVEQIDLPLDMAIDPCGQLYVNNLILSGSTGSPPFYFGLDATLDFDLEIYQRFPSADITPPVAQCIANLTIDLATGESRTITDAELDNGSYDFCGNVTFDLSKDTFTEADEGSNTVTLSVTDEQGNTSVCQVLVQVNVESTPDTTDPVFTSCSPVNTTFGNDTGECGAIINYSEPSATDNSGTVNIQRTAGPAPGALFAVGSTIVTYTATDGAGNTAVCSFTITVTDEEDPEISCPIDIFETVAIGETGKTVDYTLPTLGDNCPGATILQTAGEESGGIFPLGETVNTFVVTDASGRTATCSFKVTITEAVDEEDPVINCPQPIFTLTDAGQCGATVTYQLPEATDNAGPPQVTKLDGPNSGDFLAPGGYEVIFEARDAANNTATCTLEIVVQDEEAPVFTACISNEVQFIESTNGVYFVPSFIEEVEAVDNCTVNVSYTQSIAAGTEITEDTFIDIFAYDEFGNESESCSFQVVLVEEEQPLTISCPGNLEIDLENNCEFMLPDYRNLVSATEGAIIVQSPVAGTTITEDTEVFFTAALDGETANCSFWVRLINQSELEINCLQNHNVEVNSDGNFVIPDYTNLVNTTGRCGALSVVQDPPVGTVVNSNTLITLMATDEIGNVDDCFFSINLVDPDGPNPLTISCPQDLEIDLENTCEFILPDYKDLISATEGATIIQSPVEGTTITEDTEVFFTAELDRETANCSFWVRLINQGELEINCLQDHNVDVDSDGNFVIPNYTNQVNTTGNCGRLNIVQDPPVGTVVNSNTLITLTATDEIGNVDDCFFTINLVDPDEPNPLSISCPGDLTESLGDNCSFILPDYTGMANVTLPSAQVSQDPPVGTMVSGPTEVTLTAVDGNETASCSFMLELADNTPPTISCRETFEVFLNEEGYGIISAEILLSNATDNCGIQSTVLSQTRFETTDVGDNEILVTVTDVNGNVSECTTTVTVTPFEQSGGVSCTASITLPLNEEGKAELNLTYSGNEENIELELSKSNFSCEDIGSQMITATYIGEYTGSCDIEIIIIDNLPPVVNCVSPIDLILDENGEAVISENDVYLGSTDNCAIETVLLSKTVFTTADLGSQQVRLNVTDSSGNVGFCDVTVNVKPYIATTGELNCVESLRLELDADGQAVLSAQDLYAGDPEGVEFFGEITYSCEDIGFHTVTLTQKDDPSQSCEVQVEVVDVMAPVAVCKSDIELTLNANGTATLSAEDFGEGSSDNCEITSYSLDKSSFSTADIGEQQVTLIVTDSSGNQATCEATITILPPNENPQAVVCVDLFTLSLNANGRAELQPEDLFTGGTEDGTYTVSRSGFTCADIGENSVTLTYSTAYEQGSCTIKVVVEDPQSYCETPPGPIEGDSLILYPNPGDGFIKFKVSQGLQIQRIEVFDIRGRFIMEHMYDNTVPNLPYTLDLRAYQAGVYPMLIYTNGREYLKRAIIK